MAQANEKVILSKARNTPVAGFKRDYTGNKKVVPAKDLVRNEYTSMFENFRDELDKHHDRRQNIGKVSRDVTVLSKKM
jgi:hypothetical protein